VTFPVAPVAPDATESEKGHLKHFNTLMDELRWFFENGIRIQIKWKSTGYEMVFSTGPKPQKKSSK
jgi:hypothetical protein